MTERERIGIGVVGAGFLAETRARCYGRVAGIEARIVAVASRGGERAKAYAERHRVPHLCAHLDELLALDEVQVVDLCVPNLMHRPMAEAAAAAGKHVICTKPLTAYVGQDLGPEATEADVSGRDAGAMLAVATEDARAMVDAAERAGVLLCYGENWVYAPAIARARGLMRASGGVALELRGWEAHSGSHSPYSKLWRNAGGGALIRLAAHPIGAMLHWKREEGIARDGKPIRPVTVTAEVCDLTKNGALTETNTKVATGWVDVESWGQVVIAFEDGSRGVAHGSDVLLGGMESKLEVLGSNAHLKCSLSPNDMLRAYAAEGAGFGDEYVMEKHDARSGWCTPMPDEDSSSGQLAMCQAFVEAVASGEPAAADGALGLDVTRVVYSAYLSAREGRRVGLVPLD